MNFLVTGAWACAEEQQNRLKELGHEVLFLQYEKDPLPCAYEWVEGVVCNGLFLSHSIEKFTHLKYIQLTSAGYDRVPMDYIHENGIEIHNAAGVYSIPIAESVVSGVLQIYRNARSFFQKQERHEWEKDRDLKELNEKTVCIIGCGSVGTECAKKFKAFNCTVCGIDLNSRTDPNFDRILSREEMNVLLEQSDVVVITAPLTEETYHLFNKERFSHMKQGSILVNVARGEIVDTNDLIHAHLFGAVLDVFEEEPVAKDSPLWDMDNVILTPHNSFAGDSNLQRLNACILQTLRAKKDRETASREPETTPQTEAQKKINFAELKHKAKQDLIDAGVSETQAEIIADCAATADLYGVSSHGCSVLPSHIARVKRGGYNLNPDLRIVRETAAFAVVDGDNAIGPVSADFCLKYASEKARKSGVFTVFSKNNNTFGPAFYYSLKAAQKGLMAFVCSNSPAQMAPFGGKEKMLGTNPLSMVVPVPGRDPIMIDMATSVVAKSKFKEYKEQGRSLPEGWALDRNGHPTTDPDEAIQGFVMPMGGYKGYALSLLIDIVSGVLSGASYLNKVGRFYSDDGKSMNVGFYMVVLYPKIICGDGYDEEILRFVDSLRNSIAEDGQCVSVPGDDRNRIMHANSSEQCV